MALFVKFLIFFLIFGGMAVSLATIIMGIVVLSKKIGKAVNILGWSLVISGTGGLISSVSVFLKFFREEVYYSNLDTIVTLVLLIFSLAEMVFIFLYPKIRYGSSLKGLVAVQVIALCRVVANYFLANLLYADLVNDHVGMTRVSNVLSIIASLFSVAIAVIIFRVYYKNRHKEDLFPMLWVFKLIPFVSIPLGIITNIIGMIYIPERAADTDISQVIRLALTCAFMIVGLIPAIYITSKVCKAKKKAVSEEA